MKRILLFLAFLISPCFLFAQNVSFYFTNAPYIPTPGSIWKDTGININLVVYAPGPVATVTAAAGGRQKALEKYTLNEDYRGYLSLQGLAGDTLTLVVAATDSLGNSGDTSIRFIYRPLNDPGVTLTIDSLADGATSRSSFPLGARSAGNAIDVYNVVNSYTETLVARARDSMPVVDLSQYNGKKLTLKVVATDSLNRTNSRQLSAFVESSPYLADFFLTDETVRDMRYNKAVIAEKGTGYPVLVDMVSGQRSTPLINAWVGTAYVTAEGAMLETNQNEIYEWKNGQLVYQGRGVGLKVAGNYAVWKKGSDSLVRKNRATGVMDSVVLAPYYGRYLDLGPTGMVTYNVNPDRYVGHIYRYDSGNVVSISQGVSGLKWDPETDGRNAIYSTSSFGDSETSIYFYNGQTKSNVLLAAGVPGVLGAGRLYQMNTGYAAFMRGNQLVLRDSLGVMRQMTNFFSCPNCYVDNMIDLLNDKGDVMVSRGDSGRYLIRNNGQLTRITTMPAMTAFNQERLGNSLYDGTNWYVQIGSKIFKVNLDSVPVNHISDFEKTMKPDSVLRFSKVDFTSHFSGPGELITVKFTVLPKHGVFKSGNWAISPNTSFAASSLSELSYTPDSAYTGTDTIRWIASNGLEYTSDTGSVIINVKDSVVVVPQPVVTGLSSSYCIAADSQQVKIANLPVAASGIMVAVVLDSTTVLPVKPDSTFTIRPAALNPGRHNLSVTFSYDTIQKRLPLSFNVTPAVTPSLDIMVNVNPITTDSIPVVITATNVTGGGKQPLYTFARDRDFVHQLQVESNSNTVTVSPTEFELGDNVIYARVRTSDQCYVSQTGIDSITINKTNITAIVDIDNPGKPVVVYPNPFREQVSINGLQPSKTYIISLYDIQGKLLLHKRVVNQVKTEINPPAVNGGVYILRVYDEKAKKLLGAQKLIGY